MEFEKLIRERYSCRKLKDTPIEKEKLERILEAGIAAPTGCNYQPYKLWVLTGEENCRVMSELTKHTFGAGTFIVVGGAATELICTTSAMPGLILGPSHHVATTAESTCSRSPNMSLTLSATVVQPHSAQHAPSMNAHRLPKYRYTFSMCCVLYTKLMRKVNAALQTPLSRFFRGNLSRILARPPKTLGEKYFCRPQEASWTFFRGGRT